MAQRGRAGEDNPANGERELVERAIGGDRDSFEALYGLHVEAVFAFLRARGPLELAEDFTAETFCRAYQNIGRYEWRGPPFRAWLLCIARNLLIAHWRAKESKVLLLDDLETVVTPSVDADPTEGVNAGQMAALLATLSTRHREVIELRFIEERTVAETATLLAMTGEAVRALTLRAMKQLRKVSAHSDISGH
ncbi:MAG: RNA polymerase sigma factor [Acidimicrobiia bacterium]|nr:RNA polymerase sigma factor [Acidimicrobiia bacterium]